MEKVVYLLLGPGGVASSALTHPLSSAPVRAELLTAARKHGAGAIQINTADALLGHPFGVAPDEALPHLAAYVSVWVDAVELSTDPIRRALPSLPDATWHGYLVTESEPLPNRSHPPGPDGHVPGFVQVVALTRPAHLSWGEWRRIWQGSHTSVALNTQSTFRYVQNVIVRPVTDQAPAYAAVVEESFPAEASQDLHVFFDAVGDDAKLQRHMDAMSASCDRFMDGSAPVSWTSEWHYPAPDAAGAHPKP